MFAAIRKALGKPVEQGSIFTHLLKTCNDHKQSSQEAKLAFGEVEKSANVLMTQNSNGANPIIYAAILLGDIEESGYAGKANLREFIRNCLGLLLKDTKEGKGLLCQVLTAQDDRGYTILHYLFSFRQYDLAQEIIEIAKGIGFWNGLKQIQNPSIVDVLRTLRCRQKREGYLRQFFTIAEDQTIFTAIDQANSEDIGARVAGIKHQVLINPNVLNQHHAADHGSTPIFSLLYRIQDGKTPPELKQEFHHLVLELLNTEGLDFLETTADFNTILHFSIYKNMFEIANRILERAIETGQLGALVNCRNTQGTSETFVDNLYQVGNSLFQQLNGKWNLFLYGIKLQQTHGKFKGVGINDPFKLSLFLAQRPDQLFRNTSDAIFSMFTLLNDILEWRRLALTILSHFDFPGLRSLIDSFHPSIVMFAQNNQCELRALTMPQLPAKKSVSTAAHVSVALASSSVQEGKDPGTGAASSPKEQTHSQVPMTESVPAPALSVSASAVDSVTDGSGHEAPIGEAMEGGVTASLTSRG